MSNELRLRMSAASKLLALNPIGQDCTMALVLAVLDPSSPLDPALVELVGAKAHSEASRAQRLLHEAAEAGDRASDMDELYQGLKSLDGPELAKPPSVTIFGRNDLTGEVIAPGEAFAPEVIEPEPKG